MSAVQSLRDPQEGILAEETSRLYQRHSHSVFRFCLQRLRSREDADDAVQTTFLYALMSLRRGVVPEFETAWLLKIADNVCASRHRAATRRGRVESAHDLDAIQDVLRAPEDRSDHAEELRAALITMPESQRRAILLREWRGLTYSEIGDELGLSQAAVETLIFRARRTLAAKLTELRATYTLNLLPAISYVRTILQGGPGRAAAVAAAAAASMAAAPAIEQHIAHADVAPKPRAATLAQASSPKRVRLRVSTTSAPERQRQRPHKSATVPRAARPAPPARPPQSADDAALPSTARPAAPSSPPREQPEPMPKAPPPASSDSDKPPVSVALAPSAPSVAAPPVEPPPLPPAPLLPSAPVSAPALPTVEAPALPAP